MLSNDPKIIFFGSELISLWLVYGHWNSFWLLATKHVIHFRYVTNPNSSNSFTTFTWATTTTTILILLESHLNCDICLNLDSQSPAPPCCTIAASITIGSATRGAPLKPGPVAMNKDWGVGYRQQVVGVPIMAMKELLPCSRPQALAHASSLCHSNTIL